MQLLWLDFIAWWIQVMVFLTTYFLVSLFAKYMAYKSAVKSQEQNKNSYPIFYIWSDRYHSSATHSYQYYFIAFFEY